MTTWVHKDEWRRTAESFCVTVTRHIIPEYDDRGPNGWAVYAYIYPKHPRFARFKYRGWSVFHPGVEGLPLHRRCSFIDYHERDGDCSSVQIGADYCREDDAWATVCVTKEEAAAVFHDADRLYEVLLSEAMQEPQP